MSDTNFMMPAAAAPAAPAVSGSAGASFSFSDSLGGFVVVFPPIECGRKLWGNVQLNLHVKLKRGEVELRAFQQKVVLVEGVNKV